MTVSDDLVGLFEQGEIDHVFGFPCEQMEPNYASIAGSKIQHVLVRSRASASVTNEVLVQSGESDSPDRLTK